MANKAGADSLILVVILTFRFVFLVSNKGVLKNLILICLRVKRRVNHRLLVLVHTLARGGPHGILAFNKGSIAIGLEVFVGVHEEVRLQLRIRAILYGTGVELDEDLLPHAGV